MLSSSLLRWGTPYLAWHADVIMVVADALAPNGHHGISYHRNDSAMTLVSNGQPNRVTDINKQCSREVGIPLYFCYWLVRFLTPMMLSGGVKSHRTHVPRNELTRDYLKFARDIKFRRIKTKPWIYPCAGQYGDQDSKVAQRAPNLGIMS